MVVHSTACPIGVEWTAVQIKKNVYNDEGCTVFDHLGIVSPYCRYFNIVKLTKSVISSPKIVLNY